VPKTKVTQKYRAGIIWDQVGPTMFIISILLRGTNLLKYHTQA